MMLFLGKRRKKLWTARRLAQKLWRKEEMRSKLCQPSPSHFLRNLLHCFPTWSSFLNPQKSQWWQHSKVFAHFSVLCKTWEQVKNVFIWKNILWDQQFIWNITFLKKIYLGFCVERKTKDSELTVGEVVHREICRIAPRDVNHPYQIRELLAETSKRDALNVNIKHDCLNK